MSLLSELKPKRGSTHKKKRVGRGDGSGWGGTAGKGHKGQKARSGAPIKRGFEGGQMQMARRLPKFGFTNTNFKTTYNIVNISQLNNLDGEVTPQMLKDMGLVGTGLVKILADGELSKALTVKAHKFSESAKKAIEGAGGTAEVIK
ncbi:MAG: 50S ribosomal protein L15 [Bdellovibrionales bacterium]|nr:50S ribosomal protein L15 [Bdellovibrionales bacterium]